MAVAEDMLAVSVGSMAEAVVVVGMVGAVMAVAATVLVVVSLGA